MSSQIKDAKNLSTHTLVGRRSGGFVQGGDAFGALIVFSVELGSGCLDLVSVRRQNGLEALVNALDECGLRMWEEDSGRVSRRTHDEESELTGHEVYLHP